MLGRSWRPRLPRAPKIGAGFDGKIDGMHEHTVALVTGANKGIGLQIAKALAARGVTVLIGARNLDLGTAAARSVPRAGAVQLDVTDAASITRAAARIESELGRLDILVNNAAIARTPGPARTLEESVASAAPSVAKLDDVRAIFETNVFGVIAVTQAMLPLLRRAPAGRIVNVSSGGGSLTAMSDRGNPYRRMMGVTYGPSKTALNAITLAFAAELETTTIKVNAADPGYTATDLNDFRGVRTVEQAAREPVRLALLGDDGPTGSFSNEDGPLPW